MPVPPVLGEAPLNPPPVDPDGFEHAVRSVWRTLHSIAASVLGRRDDAEDVVQDAVIVALGKRNELPNVRNFTAWMGQIVRFVALNRRRSNRLRSPHATETCGTVSAARHPRPPARDGPAARVDPRGQLSGGDFEFDDHVLKALDALDEIPRACLLLRVINELSYREIARVLDIPEGTAMSHVFRARRSLLERLSKPQD